MFEFWFCLLSKSFNLRSPSVFICKQPFLNDPTGVLGQSSHAGSHLSLGLPVPLASPCAHLYPPPLPSKVIHFYFTQVYFSHSSSLTFHCALSLSPGQERGCMRAGSWRVKSGAAPAPGWFCSLLHPWCPDLCLAQRSSKNCWMNSDHWDYACAWAL